MYAKDIMTKSVITVGPETTVRNIALLLCEKAISMLPVVEHHSVLGIVSESDLIHRQELGTDKDSRISWLRVFGDAKSASAESFSAGYAKSHGQHARDVMTRKIVSVSEHASLSEVADTMETNHVRRVLVMRDAKLVGIISRADLVRALAARPEGAHAPVSSDDIEIRAKVIETIECMPGTRPWGTTVIVTNGVVDLYGGIEDETKLNPSRIAVENIPNVIKVRDHRAILQPY